MSEPYPVDGGVLAQAGNGLFQEAFLTGLTGFWADQGAMHERLKGLCYEIDNATLEENEYSSLSTEAADVPIYRYTVVCENILA